MPRYFVVSIPAHAVHRTSRGTVWKLGYGDERLHFARLILWRVT